MRVCRIRRPSIDNRARFNSQFRGSREPNGEIRYNTSLLVWRKVATFTQAGALKTSPLIAY
jgi:hypothetical protein